MDKSNNYADAGMLIRRPIETVFQAFIDPDTTTKFWFTKSSGKLEEGKSVEWTWEMYNHSMVVKVKKVVRNKSIIIEWENHGHRTEVKWEFQSLDETRTFVTIVNSGFVGTTDELISAIRDSTGGYSWVLAGLKAYLEHGIELNLTADRFPKELRGH